MSIDNLAGVTLGTNGIAPGTEVSVATTSNSIVLTWDGTATYTEDEAADFTVDDNLLLGDWEYHAYMDGHRRMQQFRYGSSVLHNR